MLPFYGCEDRECESMRIILAVFFRQRLHSHLIRVKTECGSVKIVLIILVTANAWGSETKAYGLGHISKSVSIYCP